MVTTQQNQKKRLIKYLFGDTLNISPKVGPLQLHFTYHSQLQRLTHGFVELPSSQNVWAHACPNGLFLAPLMTYTNLPCTLYEFTGGSRHDNLVLLLFVPPPA